MLEILTKTSWTMLAMIHLSPAAVVLAPSLIDKLYGVENGGDLGTLLRHRGVLFVAILAACLFGLFDPAARRATSVIVAFSVIGFLWVYWRAGMPAGRLRRVALVDLVGLIPLAFVFYIAWR